MFHLHLGGRSPYKKAKTAKASSWMNSEESPPLLLKETCRTLHIVRAAQHKHKHMHSSGGQ